MCNFFSFRSDGAGNYYYLNAEQREEARRNGNNPDSHSYIAEIFGFKGKDDDLLNKYEYDPFTKDFRVDNIVSDKMNDEIAAREWVKTLDFKKIDPEMFADTGKKFRFKTEQEFLSDFGERWRSVIKFGWNGGGDMDYLFGQYFICRNIVNNSVTSENEIEGPWHISRDMVIEVL